MNENRLVSWQTQIRQAAARHMREWRENRRLFHYATGARGLPTTTSPADLPGHYNYEDRRIR